MNKSILMVPARIDRVFKPRLLWLSLVLLCLISSSAVDSFYPESPQAKITAAITICGGTRWAEGDTTIAPSLDSGLGDLHYVITTKEPLAQKFFDQGLRLIYGFNHVEALRAFREAARLDPSCPMAYWGQAMTLGPNINDWNPKDREAMALNAIVQAKKLSVNGTTKEKDFIDALAVRYDGQAHDNRDALNQAYKISMKALAEKYHDDAEALTFYADAIMNSMPWDYWNADGSPKSFTPDARASLEAALKKYPKHPGAHHLYIHLIEASRQPGDARKSAQFLETAMPNAGHIVHMPSHIYARLGEYERSNNANQKAIAVDEKYLASLSDVGFYGISYYPHNIDFLCFGSLMNGQSSQAVAQGKKMVEKSNPMEASMPVMYDYFLSVPVITLVRFEKWDEILALPANDKKFFQTSALHHYARGMAFLQKGRLAESEAQWAILDSINRLDTLNRSYAFYNSTHQIVNVASLLLRSEILLRKTQTNEGIKHLRAAVAAEDSLRYNEPPDWRLPTRYFLAGALLRAKKYEDAEKNYTEDLQKNPENGWSLHGLMMAQRKLGKAKDADKTSDRFKRAWARSDFKLN